MDNEYATPGSKSKVLKKNYRARRRTYGVHLILVFGNGINYNVYHNYSMNGENFQAVSEETDLGIIISSDLIVRLSLMRKSPSLFLE